MLYRSSDCIFSRRLEKTSFSHFDERFSYLDERFSDFVTRIGHVFMSHRYHGFHRYFFESRKRRGYEPFSLSLLRRAKRTSSNVSHCQPDARSASKAGRRKARRDNHTNEGAQTWLYHTDSTDVTDIFSNHEKGEVASLFKVSLRKFFRDTQNRGDRSRAPRLVA